MYIVENWQGFETDVIQQQKIKHLSLIAHFGQLLSNVYFLTEPLRLLLVDHLRGNSYQIYIIIVSVVDLLKIHIGASLRINVANPN